MAVSRIVFVSMLVWATVTAVHAETIAILPYVQHGPDGGMGQTDSKVIMWMADQTGGAGKDGDWSVEFSAGGSGSQTAIPAPRKVTPTSKHAVIDLVTNKPKVDDKFDQEAKKKLPAKVDWVFYRATLDNLPLNSTVSYRVLQNGKQISAATFPTRKTADQALNFVVFGDSGAGTAEQKKIAYQTSLAKPELIVNVGDNVYSNGRTSEYMTKFFPVYDNAEGASPTIGAPLIRSVPYYVAIGNHDVAQPNLDEVPDAMAFYYFFDLPTNGLDATFKYIPKLAGSKEKLAEFKRLAGDRFPKLDNYSFDNGPAHFLLLDANKYINVTDKTFLEWIDRDLAAASGAKWKFVFFHQPGFTAAKHHFEEQRMRALSPIFEKHGVNIVFAGHVHNYQRTKPFFFKPTTDANGKITIMPDGHVGGDFKIDDRFDGKNDTTPEGIVYIVSGGGGASLHSKDSVGEVPEIEPAKTQPAPAKVAAPDKNTTLPADDISDHMAVFVADRWSFTRIQLTPEKLIVTQVDADGQPFDTLTITH